jgi:hypothetical protein
VRCCTGCPDLSDHAVDHGQVRVPIRRTSRCTLVTEQRARDAQLGDRARRLGVEGSPPTAECHSRGALDPHRPRRPDRPVLRTAGSRGRALPRAGRRGRRARHRGQRQGPHDTRRIEGLAIAVISLLLLGSALSLITGSPRFLLAKDAALTTVWGAWFFLSLRARRPLTFRFTRPLLEGRKALDSVTRTWRTPAAGTWDRLWERNPDFRRMWHVTTVIWGTALILDAAVRVTMAYTLPLDVVPGLAGFCGS